MFLSVSVPRSGGGEDRWLGVCICVCVCVCVRVCVCERERERERDLLPRSTQLRVIGSKTRACSRLERRTAAPALGFPEFCGDAFAEILAVGARLPRSFP